MNNRISIHSIQLNNVCPSYLEDYKIQSSAIWNQQIVFHKGELVQIVAPSGSGKTTLIHSLYGMNHHYNGTVSYDDKTIKDLDQHALSSYRSDTVSVIFQDLRLFPEQTVWENLRIKQILHPYYADEKIKEMCNQLGIAHKLNQLAGTCSYGEQQRVAIIRALTQPFDFLLLDEPFSHLDEDNANKAAVLITEEVKARSAGMILADLAEISFIHFDRKYRL